MLLVYSSCFGCDIVLGTGNYNVCKYLQKPSAAILWQLIDPADGLQRYSSLLMVKSKRSQAMEPWSQVGPIKKSTVARVMHPNYLCCEQMTAL